VKEHSVGLTNGEAMTEARSYSDPTDSAGRAHPAGLAQGQPLVEARRVPILAATAKHPHPALIELAARGCHPGRVQLRVELLEPHG